MGSDGVREILGRKRTLEILDYLSGGTVRNYSEIEEELETSTDTISESLSILRNHGLVRRNEVSKKDVRYQITQKGERFLEMTRTLEAILSEDN
jgi:DNA-binding HxlR family transcriptional regulator